VTAPGEEHRSADAAKWDAALAGPGRARCHDVRQGDGSTSTWRAGTGGLPRCSKLNNRETARACSCCELDLTPKKIRLFYRPGAPQAWRGRELLLRRRRSPAFGFGGWRRGRGPWAWVGAASPARGAHRWPRRLYGRFPVTSPEADVVGSRGRRVDPLSVRGRGCSRHRRVGPDGVRCSPLAGGHANWEPRPFGGSAAAALLLAFFRVTDDTVGRSWRGPKLVLGPFPLVLPLPFLWRKFFFFFVLLLPLVY